MPTGEVSGEDIAKYPTLHIALLIADVQKVKPRDLTEKYPVIHRKTSKLT